MNLNLMKLYSLLKPILLVICFGILILNATHIYFEIEYPSSIEIIDEISITLTFLYYFLTLAILYFISFMKQSLMSKIAIGICLLTLFPQIAMLMLLLLDKGLKKGIELKNTASI